MHSIDGGTTWNKFPLEPPSVIGIAVGFTAVAADSTGAVASAYVAEGSQGVGAPESLYIYAKPPNGGWRGPLKAWGGKTVFDGIPVLRAVAGAWWLAVGSTVSTSTDGGVHFASHPVPMPADAIIVAYDFVGGCVPIGSPA